MGESVFMVGFVCGLIKWLGEIPNPVLDVLERAKSLAADRRFGP